MISLHHNRLSSGHAADSNGSSDCKTSPLYSLPSLLPFSLKLKDEACGKGDDGSKSLVPKERHGGSASARAAGCMLHLPLCGAEQRPQPSPLSALHTHHAGSGENKPASSQHRPSECWEFRSFKDECFLSEPGTWIHMHFPAGFPRKGKAGSTCTRTCAHIHKHRHTRAQGYRHICTCAFMDTHGNRHEHRHMHMHGCAHAHVHTWTHRNTYTGAYT